MEEDKILREKMQQEIGQRVSQLRQKAGLKQRELGDKLGMRQTRISALEKGRYLVRAEQLIKLCQVFGVSADYILFGTEGALTDPQLQAFSMWAETLSPAEQEGLDAICAGIRQLHEK